MALIKKKTKKAITKQVMKLVKKHGPEIALGAATALVGSVVAAAASAKETKDAKKKSSSDKKSATGKKEGRESQRA